MNAESSTPPPQLARDLGLRYGLWLGGLLALLEVAFFAIDQYGETYTTVINWSLGLLAMTWSAWQFRQQNQGWMTLGQSFRVSLTTLVVGIGLQAIASALYTSLIDPQATERYLTRMREDLLSQPQLAEEAIEMALSMTEKMSQPFIAVPLAIVSAAFGGSIAALIIGLLLQKRPDQG